MNVSVLSSDGLISCRPDTTIEYEDRDFYVPDGAESLSFAPALFVRMGRSGKCISRKFAGRYFESVCPGVLLYVNAADSAAGSVSRVGGLSAGSGLSGAAGLGDVSAALYDHSTVVPRTFYNKVTFSSVENEFEVLLDGKSIFTFRPEEVRSADGIGAGNGEDPKASTRAICTQTGGDTVSMLEGAIEKVSAVMSQRIGDLVAVELCNPQLLISRDSSRARLTGSWCENPLFDREIVF